MMQEEVFGGFFKPQEQTKMASITDRGMSLLKNSEADYSLKIPLRTELNRNEEAWQIEPLC